jgi:polar amino acid transport system substrate-binding protein
MRKWGLVLAAIAVMFGVAACGGDDSSNSSKTTTTTAGTSAQVAGFKPVTAGTLTVVTSLPGPGFWEGSDTDPTKVTSGYEYDIAQEMKSQFGLTKLVVRNVSFDDIVAGNAKDYDLALSQISITPERAKVVSFSDPYFESNQGILVKKGHDITTLAQAKAAQWGVQTSTTAVDLLDKIKPSKTPRVYQQLPDAYTALQAGQVDAVLIDTAINLGEAARSNGQFVVSAQFDQPGGPDKYGAILPKGSTNVTAVNKAFANLKSSGQLDELAKKDLTADPGTIPVIKVS